MLQISVRSKETVETQEKICIKFATSIRLGFLKISFFIKEKFFNKMLLYLKKFVNKKFKL